MADFASVGELPTIKYNITFPYYANIDITGFSFNSSINSVAKSAPRDFRDVGILLPNKANVGSGGGAATAVVGAGLSAVGPAVATAVVGAGLSAVGPAVATAIVGAGLSAFDVGGAATAVVGAGLSAGGMSAAFELGGVGVIAGFASAGVFQLGGTNLILPGFGTAGTLPGIGFSAILPGFANIGDLPAPVLPTFMEIGPDMGISMIPGTPAWNMNIELLGQGSMVADQIEGNGGNNLIFGYGGDDLLNGGDGIDTAAFRGKIDEYRFIFDSNNGGKLVIADLVAGRDGIDQLTGFEYVKLGTEVYSEEDMRKLALQQSEPKFVPEVKRLYNQLTGKHLLCANQTEVDYLTGGSLGWVNEGDAYKTSDNTTENVYRFSVNGSHFYTASESEKNTLISDPQFKDFSLDGIIHGCYAAESGPPPGVETVAVKRYLNLDTGSHLISSSLEEQLNFVGNDLYVDEGIAWYAETL